MKIEIQSLEIGIGMKKVIEIKIIISVIQKFVIGIQGLMFMSERKNLMIVIVIQIQPQLLF